MIFYFSGTGNSRWVAEQLSNTLNEPLLSISKEIYCDISKNRTTLKEDEKIIFVYPIHSWGPPSIVLDFINKINFANYTDQPIFSVCTCGDDCGYTTEIINKQLKKKGLQLSGSYSVTMPNNYILLPGFDVDSDNVEKCKLSEAPFRVKLITQAIQENSNKNLLYSKGTIPFIKSYIINPLFVKFDLGRNSFYATDACTSCGLCAKVCPTNTITMKDKKPAWNKTCIKCLGCIHRCPAKAIEHGKITRKRGRYVHPELKTQL